MDNKHKELWVGVTVLAAIISLIALAIYFGKGESVNFGDEYTIKVRFQRTPGIAKRSPVYKNGVKIGVVTNVELVDEDREVEITIRLPVSRKIYTNEECRVRQTVIMGDATLEFVKDINYKGEIELVGADSPPLVGRESSDILRSFTNLEGDLNKTLQVIGNAVERIGEFVERANIIIGSPEDAKGRHNKIDEVVAELQQTMLAIRNFSNQANSLVNDPNLQKDVKQIISVLSAILNKSQNIFADAELLIADSRGFIKHGNESLGKVDLVINNVTKITDNVQGDVPAIMESLKMSSVKLQTLFDELIIVFKAFQNSEGTLGKIINDPAAYQKLLLTLDNIEKITQDVNLLIRTDVKPVSTNLRLFTDEIARDPSVFIRNLIKKRSPVKNGIPVWGDGLGSDKLLNFQGGCYVDSMIVNEQELDCTNNQNYQNYQNYTDSFELPCCTECYCFPCCCDLKRNFSSLIPDCIVSLFNKNKNKKKSNCSTCSGTTCSGGESCNQHSDIYENNDYSKTNLRINNLQNSKSDKKNIMPNELLIQDKSEYEPDGVIINTDPRYPTAAGKSDIVQMSFNKIETNTKVNTKINVISNDITTKNEETTIPTKLIFQIDKTTRDDKK
ncbi:MAG: MlaD family protein [Planctomycetaceae bacterium]|jgi:ABC-type transporter Mla subunit MlaD|nr:MlaD family protein [Planctomycetaceae bacterium]